MKKVLFITVLVIGVFMSCEDKDDTVSMVNIRIQNNTSVLFNEVRVAQRDTVYVNIASGEFSEYIDFEKAYATAAVTVLTDSTTLNYFPSETVLDSLPIGFYTYELSLDAEDKLALTFKVD